MNVNAGAKVLFVVIGTFSLATLWRVWPRTNVSERLIPPDASPLQRLLYTFLPFVLPIVFGLSVLYCALSLLQDYSLWLRSL